MSIINSFIIDGQLNPQVRTVRDGFHFLNVEFIFIFMLL
jgi:hypothetical protein